MSRNKTLLAVSLFIVASMVMAACQPAPASPEAVIETVVVEGEGEEVIVVVEGEDGRSCPRRRESPAPQYQYRLSYY